MVLSGILATDMDRHGALLKSFNAARPMHEIATEEVTKEELQSFMQCIVKCGDLGHLVRPWPHAKKWEDLVMVEFFKQGDLEKEVGFSVMSLFDRDVCNIP